MQVVHLVCYEDRRNVRIVQLIASSQMVLLLADRSAVGRRRELSLGSPISARAIPTRRRIPSDNSIGILSRHLPDSRIAACV